MTRQVNTRELVLDILLSVTRDGEYSHIALANVLDKYQYLDKKERAFITRVTEGTLEQLLRINDILDHISKVPVQKMKPVIRCILQSGVYQICFMDAVPDAAVCDESVRLTMKRGFRNLKGYVNGVLRNVSREKENLPYPDRVTEPEHYLSIRYSIPEWMIRMWEKDFCYDFSRETDLEAMESMLKAFQQQAPLTIRTNRNKCTPEELKQRLEKEHVTVALDEKLDYAFRISGFDHLNALDCFKKGLFYVQDTSSMLVAETARPKKQDFILDVCAAPGGKAIHMAELLDGTGHVLARDLTEYKVSLIKENINRCEMNNIEAKVWDARIFDPELEKRADIVIADLPCSGLGVLRRKKDIRYKMTPEKMEELVFLQREILDTVCRYVRPGGKMVYSTCTVHQAENEGNARWFEEHHPEFVLSSSRQILPGEAGADGFYIALFSRTEKRYS